MLIIRTLFATALISLAGVSLLPAVHAQDAPSAPKAAAKPSEAEMMAKMMELANPGEHHRELEPLVGNWDYTVKFSMAPGQPMGDAGHGTAVRAALMGGRYFLMNVNGQMLMPDAEGKMKETEFKGMEVDGYDNVKQKFVSTWIDNMGTSIVVSDGSYDAASKTFTYLFEMEVLPGVKVKARQVLKMLDADHHQLDWYETRGGQEVETMQIAYTRQK